MNKGIQFTIGVVLLIAIEVFKVYFIMPFPASQRAETIEAAYFIHKNIFWLRTVGLLIIALPAFYFLAYGKLSAKIATLAAFIFYGVVFYFFNFRFLAEKMFYQPRTKLTVSPADNKVPQSALVIGVSIKDKAKAYPIEVIGYHHQVRDTIADTPVMITYCTVCRTGRAYSPIVDGHNEDFRLVGMDHFNAMFEDATTGSWWRQVNGEAIAGPLQGKSLQEIPSEQMTLRAWLEQHPGSDILQRDPAFQAEYDSLHGFDSGKINSGLERRDTLSWKDKSWVVGVQVGLTARAYDWNDLTRLRTINDTLAGQPILVAVEGDSSSFHIWHRDSLSFRMDNTHLVDVQTDSRWDMSGRCIEGKLAGAKLARIQAYQEFWHSWQTFHPQTTQYRP